MSSLTFKPAHKVVQDYYDSRTDFAQLGIKQETVVRSALHELLEHSSRQFDWIFVTEHAFKRGAPSRREDRQSRWWKASPSR